MEALILQAIDEVALEGAEGILAPKHSINRSEPGSYVRSIDRMTGLTSCLV